jgi:outer membrane lipoprotein-sorting protein
MKKLFLMLTCLLAVSVISAQSLEEIVKKYAVVMKLDQRAKVQTIKITAKISAMGTEMPMTLFMKNPNKVKSVTNFGGQDMVSVFDGEKGYSINPMVGADPVELTGAQLDQVKNNNAFSDELDRYSKAGKLTLEGEDNVNGKAVFKIKATVVGGESIYFYIDKSSFYIIKMSTKMDQMGQVMEIDSYLSDYTDIQGIVLPKKTTLSSGGTEMAVVTYDNIEVNIPIDDSIFTLKK